MCKISKRSKISSRRRCHSPPTRREVPALLQAAEETPLVASPASSWVETSQFVFLWFFLFCFFFWRQIPPTTILFLLINISASPPLLKHHHLLHLLHMHSCHHVHGPPCPLPPPANLLFWSFFLLKKKTVDKSTLCISPPLSISAHPVAHFACWERHDV